MSPGFRDVGISGATTTGIPPPPDFSRSSLPHGAGAVSDKPFNNEGFSWNTMSRIMDIVEKRIKEIAAH